MRIACLLLCAFLTGCLAPTLAPNWAEAAASRHEVAHAEHPIAAQLLVGFDPTDGSGLAEGDRALFRVALHEGVEQTGEWFLRLTAKGVTARSLAAPAQADAVVWIENDDGSHSPHLGFIGLSRPGDGDGEGAIDPETDFGEAICPVEVEVFDRSGKLLGSHLEHVVRQHLENGFATACEASASQDGSLSEDTERQQADAHVALVAFLGVIRKNEQLRDIFWQILRLPTLWSIITNFGVRIRVAPQFGDAEPSPAGANPQPMQAWNLPLQVLGNTSPVLLCNLQVVEPHSPRALCAGVVSMVVVRPGDPDTYLTMQLLAARRGPESDEGATNYDE